MTEWLDQLLTSAGPWLPPLLALAAFVEYVFPPFPGDSVTIVGAALAARGPLSLWTVYLAVNLGSCAGVVADWALGAYVRHHLDHPSRFSRLVERRILTVELRNRIERLFVRWGPWLLVANRFVPGTRALVFVVAGALRMRLAPVFLLGGLSSLAWNGVLLWAGGAIGLRLEGIEEALGHYHRVALGVLLLFAAILGLVALRRRRAPR